MLKDSETLAELLIALCREQWETIRRVIEKETGQKIPRLIDIAVSANGTKPSPRSRARTTEHFPNFSTDQRRDKIEELLLKEDLSKEKLIRGVRTAFKLGAPQYPGGNDVLTVLINGDLALMKKSNALEITGYGNAATYRLKPGVKINWTKR